MKKCILILAGTALLICLASCGNEEKKTETNPTQAAPATEKPADEPSKVEEETKTVDPIIEYSEAKTMYVMVDAGANLNYRKSPVDGEKLGKFPNGSELHVKKETRETYTIDGITAPWVYAESYADITPYGGWVFKGFLTDSEIKSIENLLIGKWDSDRYVLEIKRNGDIHLWQKESEGTGGTWKYREDKTLLFLNCQTYDEEPTSFAWTDVSVDNNTLTFKWNWDDDYDYFFRIK